MNMRIAEIRLILERLSIQTDLLMEEHPGYRTPTYVTGLFKEARINYEQITDDMQKDLDEYLKRKKALAKLTDEDKKALGLCVEELNPVKQPAAVKKEAR